MVSGCSRPVSWALVFSGAACSPSLLEAAWLWQRSGRSATVGECELTVCAPVEAVCGQRRRAASKEQCVKPLRSLGASATSAAFPATHMHWKNHHLRSCLLTHKHPASKLQTQALSSATCTTRCYQDAVPEHGGGSLASTRPQTNTPSGSIMSTTSSIQVDAYAGSVARGMLVRMTICRTPQRVASNSKKRPCARLPTSRGCTSW